MHAGRIVRRLASASSLLLGSFAPQGALAQTDAGAPEWTPLAEERRAPHHVRSLVEMGAGLALGATGYWILMDRNIADWDNPSPESRFDGEAWILDNNSLAVNFLGHPLSGGLSYSMARANHQSVAGAFGYSFLTSFLWEFLLEFKEKVSVNDTIVTPGTGVPLGEFFFKLGLYLDTRAGSSASLDVARWLLGTGVALDRSLDGRPPPRVVSRDNLGFSRAIWHEFSVRYGAQWVETPSEPDYARYGLGFSGRLVTLPGYLRPGRGGTGFYRAEVSDFSLALEASRHGAGLFVTADTLLAGYHAQAMYRAPREVRGEAATFGSSLGFVFLRSSANRYRSFEQAEAQPDPRLSYHTPHSREQYAAFHLPGLGIDLRSQRGGCRFELSGRVQPSFAGLGAAAFYDWAAANLDEKGKHILHRQGYFYGWGGAASARASLALGALRAGFDVMYGHYLSQQGLDRHIERITVDVPAEGSVLMYRGSLGLAPSTLPVTVSLDLGVRRFRSEVAGFRRAARSVERGLSASWNF